MKHFLFAALLGSTAMIPVATSAQQAQPQPGQPQQMQQGQQGQLQEMAVSDLMGLEVATQQGQTIGTVAGVVQREQARFVVIEMQQGQARVLLPLDRVNMQGEQLVAEVQQGQIMGAQAFGEQQQAQVQQVEEREMVQVRTQTEGQMAQQGSQQMQGGQQQAQTQRDPTGALISVDQQPAQVSVQQQPPQIVVRQAPPTIIVQQSQPEIIVRMPEPQVAVRQPEPQVRVQQAQPRVTTDQAQAMVRTEQAEPQVTFERTGEPQVQFQEEAGRPVVRIERMAQSEQQRQSQQTQMQGQQQAQATQPVQTRQETTTERTQIAQEQVQEREERRRVFGIGQQPQTTGTLTQQQVVVSDVEGADVYNYQGEELGTVDRVIQDPQSESHFVVVAFGGFLGLGQDEVILPLERMVLQGDRLMIQGVTEEDLEAMEDADRYTQYPQVTREQQVGIGRTN